VPKVDIMYIVADQETTAVVVEGQAGPAVVLIILERLGAGLDYMARAMMVKESLVELETDQHATEDRIPVAEVVVVDVGVTEVHILQTETMVEFVLYGQVILVNFQQLV
jgi:hypothetical protein